MPFRLVVLAAIVAATAFVVTFRGESLADNPYTLGIDADTAGNTATSLGSIDGCTSVSSGATFDVDVWTDDIPQFIAFQMELYYDPTVVTVVGVDLDQLVVSAEGTGPLFDATEPLPDEDGDLLMVALDVAGIGTTGEGVLARVTLEAVGTGYTPLAMGGAVLIDGQGQTFGDGGSGTGYFEGPFTGAIVWVDEACPTGANDADGDGVDDAADNCPSGGNPD